MNNLLKWPGDFELETYNMCDPTAYDRGRAARFADRPYDGLQTIHWRRGWQDTEDLLSGMFAYDAGRPFDPKRPRAWRNGWKYAAGSATDARLPSGVSSNR
jgi:hypothetical protein